LPRLTRRRKLVLTASVAAAVIIASALAVLTVTASVEVSGMLETNGATRASLTVRNTGPGQAVISFITVRAEGGRSIALSRFNKQGLFFVEGDSFPVLTLSGRLLAGRGARSDGPIYLEPGGEAELRLMVASETLFQPGKRYQVSVSYGAYTVLLSALLTRTVELPVSQAEQPIPVVKTYFAAPDLPGAEGDAGAEAGRMKHALDMYAAEHQVAFQVHLGDTAFTGWNQGEGFRLFAAFNVGNLEGRDISGWVMNGGVAFAWHYVFFNGSGSENWRKVFGVRYSTDWQGGSHTVELSGDPDVAPFTKDVPQNFTLLPEEDTMLLDLAYNPTVKVVAVDTYRSRPYFTYARYGEGWAFAFETHQAVDNPQPVEQLAFNALTRALKP